MPDDKIDRFGQMIRSALGVPLDTPNAEVVAHAALLRRIADTRKDVLASAGVDIVADPASAVHRCSVPKDTPVEGRWFCMICQRSWWVVNGAWESGPRGAV